MDVLAHPCGEYVFDQLQRGVPADRVCEVLLQEYLVQTTASMLHAYRRFREQQGEYWTVEHLELRHWKWLYEETSSYCRPARPERLSEIRRRLCESIGVAEELVPLGVLAQFYQKHHAHARMPLRFPASTVVTDALPRHVVDAYCGVLRGRTLPALGSRCIAMFGAMMAAQVFWNINKTYDLHVKVVSAGQ